MVAIVENVKIVAGIALDGLGQLKKLKEQPKL